MEHQHEWVVFSTALQDRALMLECVSCRAFGVVKDPSSEEWAAGYHAPSAPYRWAENDRVTVIREGGEVTSPAYVKTTEGGYEPSRRWEGLQDQAEQRSVDMDLPEFLSFVRSRYPRGVEPNAADFDMRAAPETEQDAIMQFKLAQVRKLNRLYAEWKAQQN